MKKFVEEYKKIRVYLDDKYYCDMEYIEEEQKYQGEFGCMPLETAYNAYMNRIDHIKIEKID